MGSGRDLDIPFRPLGHLGLERVLGPLPPPDRLAYARNEDYRTAKLSIPFKMVGGLNMREKEMVEPGGIEPPTS